MKRFGIECFILILVFSAFCEKCLCDEITSDSVNIFFKSDYDEVHVLHNQLVKMLDNSNIEATDFLFAEVIATKCKHALIEIGIMSHMFRCMEKSNVDDTKLAKFIKRPDEYYDCCYAAAVLPEILLTEFKDIDSISILIEDNRIMLKTRELTKRLQSLIGMLVDSLPIDCRTYYKTVKAYDNHDDILKSEENK